MDNSSTGVIDPFSTTTLVQVNHTLKSLLSPVSIKRLLKTAQRLISALEVNALHTDH